MISKVPPTLRRLLHLLGIDRSIGFTVLARLWNIASGVVNILLIARFLTPAQQGYYYTFASLVALQIVFELGFSFVILQLAAHESSHLRIEPGGEIAGSEVAHSRLASILQKSVRWYSAAAVLMAGALVIAGIYFFSAHQQASTPIAWKLPWLCVVLPVMFTFQMDPIFSFVEGCGFVSDVARMRLTQAILGSALAWLALSQHRGLFAPAALITGQAIAGFVFLASKRRLLLPLFYRDVGEQVVSWRNEIWPFQWRMAVTFSASYCTFSLFNPVLFAYRGPIEAGQMGMSVTIAGALGAVAYAWMYTKASPFGKMIARGDFATLDRLFFRTLVQSGALLLGAEAAALTVLFVVTMRYSQLASRILPLPTFALLMFSIFLNHILYSEAVYLRAHKREPFLILSVLVAALTATSTIVAGKFWGATGVTIGYFLCGGVFYLAGGTLIFKRCRRLWHSNPNSYLADPDYSVEITDMKV